MTPPARRRVVVGLGNPWRHDDGVGAAVATRAHELLAHTTDVDVHLLDGEPARLLEAWDGAAVAVVVDAARSDEVPAGAVVTVDPDAPEVRLRSSHALGLPDAVALGRQLGRLPARLVVLGVIGSDFSEGPGLTRPVQAAVEVAAGRVVRELRT